MSWIPWVPLSVALPVPVNVTADVNAFLSELVPALTSVWVEVSLDTPTLTSKVLFVLLDIFNHLSNAGSDPLGYGCFVALLSVVQVKTNAPASNLIKSPLLNPWLLIVTSNIPVAGVYVAALGVCWLKLGYKLCPFWILIVALSPVIDHDVIPLATVAATCPKFVPPIVSAVPRVADDS